MRCYTGQVYGTSAGTIDLETCTTGDLITFTFDSPQQKLYISKVNELEMICLNNQSNLQNNGRRLLIEEFVNQSVIYYPYAEYYNSGPRLEQVKICEDSNCLNYL